MHNKKISCKERKYWGGVRVSKPILIALGVLRSVKFALFDIKLICLLLIFNQLQK
jgi:hypothetical protein